MSTDTTEGPLSKRSTEIPRGALFVLLGATFVSLFGVGIIVPILPVYATELGASGFLLGVMTASFSLASAFVQPFVGVASDKHGRKPFIMAGLAMYSAAGVAYAFAPSIWTIVAVRAFQGAGAAMIFPIAMAYIGDRTPEHREGFYMGVYNVAVFAGIGAGPIIGGVFKDTLGMESGFYAMAAASLLAMVFIGMLLREDDGVVRERERDSMWRSFLVMIRSRRIKAVYALRLAFQFVTIPTWAFLPLLMIQNMDASGVQIGIIVTIRTMVSACFQPVFGWLGDRQSKVGISLIASALLVAVVVGIGFSTSFWQLVVLFTALGFVEAAILPSLSGIIVEEGRSYGMGYTLGVFTMVMNLGIFVGSMSAGLLVDGFGMTTMFVSTAAVLAFATAGSGLALRTAPRGRPIVQPRLSQPAVPASRKAR